MAFYPKDTPVFCPSVAPTTVCIGNNAGDGVTGANNVIIGDSVASTTLTTGTNNIIIGTSSAVDAATSSTSNTFKIAGGATAIMSATAINSTPVVTIPGSLIVTGGVTGSLSKVSTAQVNRATSTTLTDITGLAVPLVAGGTYIFRAYIPGVSTANGGAKFAIGTSDTLTATSISYSGQNMNGATTNMTSVTTTLGAAVAAATAVFTHAFIEGTIVVNAAGTLTAQIAQNVSHADTTSAYVNAHLFVSRVS